MNLPISIFFQECYKKTLDPTDYGFKNMDGLLKSLNDNESSVFSFKQVRQRTVMYLKGVPNEDQNYTDEVDSEGALVRKSIIFFTNVSFYPFLFLVINKIQWPNL